MFNPNDFDQAASAIPSDFFNARPACGMILGSGWSEAFTPDEEPLRIPYSQIPHLGASTVQGHSGELLLMSVQGKKVVAFAGRRHWYEGVGWLPVVLPLELMRRMGVTRLLLTNAAGGISPRLIPGDLMIITDHINVTGINPLQGPLIHGWGTRFPDQSRIYDRELSHLLYRSAMENPTRPDHLGIAEGVYVFSTGPSYETPAEIRAYSTMGADAIGMSTVPEAIVANAMGIQVAALSCITNMAAGISGPHLTHEEVLQQSQNTRPRMASVIGTFIARLP